jgi:hypothetical protein
MKTLSRIALLSLALCALQAQAVIVSTNSDALTKGPQVRVCSPAEVLTPNASLCSYASINGISDALNTARLLAPAANWNSAAGGIGLMGPLTGAEASRLNELDNVNAALSVEWLNQGRHFTGTWQRDFSGPLLLQVSEVLYDPNRISSTGYHYWMPMVNAKVGDSFSFAPDLPSANSIAWINLYTLAPIPEPATMGLMGLGLGLLAWRLRRPAQRA